MIVIVVMLMLVRGGDKIAGVDRKGSAVHADEHAENHNDLEKDSHVDAPKIVGTAVGSSHFKSSRPWMDGATAWLRLDTITPCVFIFACLFLSAKASCGRSWLRR